MSARQVIADALGQHRWKDMGVDWCSCECGVILRGRAKLTAFPADEVFRQHLADVIAVALRPEGDVVTADLIAPDAFDPALECGAWKIGLRIIGGPSHTHKCRLPTEHDGRHRCHSGDGYTW